MRRDLAAPELTLILNAVREAGSTERASRRLGYGSSWLRVKAWRDARKGVPAPQFAIDAGLWLYRRDKHLEPGVPGEDVPRGSLRAAARAGYCWSGHELAGGNLYVTPDGRRQCRACRARSSRSWRARQKTH